MIFARRPKLKPRLAIRCERHPNYRGARAPQADCSECDWIYAHRGKPFTAKAGASR